MSDSKLIIGIFLGMGVVLFMLAVAHQTPKEYDLRLSLMNESLQDCQNNLTLAQKEAEKWEFIQKYDENFYTNLVNACSDAFEDCKANLTAHGIKYGK